MKNVFKILDSIDSKIDLLIKQNEFDKRMKELGILRKKMSNAKSLMSITTIIDQSPDLKRRKYYSRNLDKIPEPQKLSTVKSRVIQTIDGLIASEVMKYYKIKR